LWDGTDTLSMLLGSFSWLVPRRIIKEITELEKTARCTQHQKLPEFTI
jgi:hypothetical protein